MGLADIRRESILGLDNIRLDLPVAGLGSRSLAAFLDYLVLAVLLLVWVLACLILVARLAPPGVPIFLLGGLFLLDWGYFAGFEIATGGRTLGKLALKLRVVTAEGGTPGAGALLIRNLVRSLDLARRRPADGGRSALPPAGGPPGRHPGGPRPAAGGRAGARPGAAGVGPAGARRWSRPCWPARRRWRTRPRSGRWRTASSIASGATPPSCWPGSTPGADPVAAIRQALQVEAGGKPDGLRPLRPSAPAALGRPSSAQLAAAGARRRGQGYGELEEMALRYRQVLHDHALAASRFPGTAAARRLQGLAVEGTRRLTGERGGRRGAGRGFFARTFPPPSSASSACSGSPWRSSCSPLRGGWRWPCCARPWACSLLGPEAVRGLEEGHLWTESLVTTVPPGLSPPPASPPTTSRWR